MTDIVQTDKVLAFAYAIASGMPDYKAYLEHWATTPHIQKKTARSNAYKLLQRPEIQAAVEKAKKDRAEALEKEEYFKSLPAELLGIALGVSELDMFHYNVVRGTVDVEDVIPVRTVTEDVDEKGNITARKTVTTFMKTKRKPNVRERQASVKALYERFGHNAPVRGLFGIKSLDDEPGQQEERVLILSTGEKVKLP